MLLWFVFVLVTCLVLVFAVYFVMISYFLLCFAWWFIVVWCSWFEFFGSVVGLLCVFVGWFAGVLLVGGFCVALHLNSA